MFLDVPNKSNDIYIVSSLTFSGCRRLHSDEERLLEKLFDFYNPSARPVIDSSDTVIVKVQFALMQIQDLVIASHL